LDTKENRAVNIILGSYNSRMTLQTLTLQTLTLQTLKAEMLLDVKFDHQKQREIPT